MKLSYIVMSIILYLTIDIQSKKKRICLGGTDCRQQLTLSEECSNFSTFNECKPWACDWLDAKNECIPKRCDNLPKNDCKINFNCKWDLSDNECVRRQAIFKKLKKRKI